MKVLDIIFKKIMATSLFYNKAMRGAETPVFFTIKKEINLIHTL